MPKDPPINSIVAAVETAHDLDAAHKREIKRRLARRLPSHWTRPPTPIAPTRKTFLLRCFQQMERLLKGRRSA